MSNEKHETLSDIVAEMRSSRFDEPRLNRYAMCVVMRLARKWADRIEVAAKRRCSDCLYNNALDDLRAENASLMQRLGVCQKVNEQQEKEYLALKSEIARLRAALKPVLSCKVMSAMTAEIESGRSDYCAAIIEKAQRIYNGSGEGGAK